MDILLTINNGLDMSIEIDLYEGDFKKVADIESAIEDALHEQMESKFGDDEWPSEWDEYNLYVDFDGYEVEPTINQLFELVNLDCDDEEIMKASLGKAPDLDGAIRLIKDGYDYYRNEDDVIDGYLESFDSDAVGHLDIYINREKLFHDLVEDYVELGSGAYLRWHNP